MTRASIPTALLLIALTACPLVRPKDDETGDGAGDDEAGPKPPASETGDGAGDDEAGPKPPASDETVGAGETGTALTCEDELANVKAALAECEAGK